jgi:L-cysteine S-thiosulfotransferase
VNRVCVTFLYVLCAHAATAGAIDATSEPIAAEPGRAAAGRDIFVDRTSGHCVLCHRVAGLDAPFQGDLGPDLSDIGARLSAAQIRYRIIDVSRLNPATIMPPYYRTESLHQVAEAYRGKTVLTGVEIEHLVAYLSSLTGREP